MEINTHRFDMTDPFAQVKQRVAQARTVMKQMPPVQRRALLEAMQTQVQNAVPINNSGGKPASASLEKIHPAAASSVVIRSKKSALAECSPL